MTEAVRNLPNAVREAVQGRIAQLHDRLGELETDARTRISRTLATGNSKLRDLDGALARVSRDDWTVPGVRRQLDGLRARAASFRASALKRAAELPGSAVERLASGTRAPVQNLAKELAEIARRIEGKPAAAPSVGNGAKTKAPK